MNIATAGYGTYKIIVEDDIERLYNFRVRAQTFTGGFTAWNQVGYDTKNQIMPVPIGPTNLTYTVQGDLLLFAWDIPPSPYLSYTKLKFLPEKLTSIDNNKWNRMLDCVDQIGRPATTATCPISVGTYAVRAYNRLGRPSDGMSYIYVSEGDVVVPVNWGELRTDAIVPLNNRPSTRDNTYNYARDLEHIVRIRNLVPDGIRQVFLDNPRPSAKGDILVNYYALPEGVPKRLRLDYLIENVSEEDVSEQDMFTIETALRGDDIFTPFTGSRIFLGPDIYLRVTLNNTTKGGRPPVILNLITILEISI